MATLYGTLGGNTGAGFSVWKATSVTNTAVTISTSSITLYSITVTGGGAASYIKFFDSESVVVGTTKPVHIISGAHASSVTMTWHIPSGITFSNGLSFVATSQAADSASAAPSSAVTSMYLVTSA